MKKNILIIGVTGVVLLGGALGVGAFSEGTQENNFISTKKAEEIAVTEVEGTVESVELEKDDGRVKYEVDLTDQNGNDDIDVDIDASSGEIIKVDRDNDDDVTASSTTSAKVNTQDKNTQAIKQRITKDEAIAIATKDTPGEVVEVDYDDGEYEIEIRTDTHEIDYEINARTGKIVEKDIDDLDDDDND
ncbi:PepSY domain-containing protein [Mesobacillus maritimus]|uniref:PepSY domain-containing protein n=1 Tax=Mesobacillus maritimus TaxID=1643336 RepID=A0ABS7K455_9BACI|nr:PepSY domain-containing protein [Mesobacillus maritimus]MBY0097015.1 PepSY domain-containing protein [Mesobacillus maritimus]